MTILMATLVASAGCLQTDDDAVTQGDPTPTAASNGNQTFEPPADNETSDGNETPPANTPPTANLTADVLNGSAPLSVNLTLDGSDADGDDLSWTLELGDGNSTEGDTLPATVAHNFTAAGNYTLWLNVTDGEATATANLTITVESGAIAYCHRPDAVPIGDYWLDDRGDPVFLGGGTWIYEESNGVDGLQIGHPELESDEYQDCPDPDTLIF